MGGSQNQESVEDSPTGTILADYTPKEEFGRQINKGPRTRRAWRQRRVGPPWLKIGNAIFDSNGLNLQTLQPSWGTALIIIVSTQPAYLPKTAVPVPPRTVSHG